MRASTIGLMRPHPAPFLIFRSGPRMAPAVLVALCLGAAAAFADVPTAEQDCVLRNLAVCEFPGSGVQSMQPGPCPVGSRTLRPSGHEDCSVAQPAVNSSAAGAPAEAGMAGVRERPAPRVAVGDHWEPVPVACAVAGGAVLLATWLRRRRRRATRPRAPVSVLALLIIAGIAGMVAWQAAAKAFSGAFNGYDNHDSAAPLLLASPIWLATFVMVFAVSFAVLMACWSVLRRAAAR